MEQANLGRTGLRVSRLCLGTMTFGLQCDEPTSHSILDAAAEGGVNFLDVADVYPLGGELDTVGRSEEIVGRWVKEKRTNFIIATKCAGRTGPNEWDAGVSRKHVLDSIDASLRRLGTDYIDLYQLHSRACRASSLVVAQWDAGERARLIGLLTDAIAAAGVKPPTGRPVGPSREQLARDEELRRLLENAGLADIRVDTVAFVEPMRNTDELWEGVLDGSVNTRATVLAQPPDVQQRIRNELDRLVEPHRHDGEIHVPVSVRIASGRRG